MRHHTTSQHKRALLFIGAGVVVCGLVWGIAGALAASPSPSPSSGKVILRVGITADPDNINPFIGSNTPAFTVWALNYDPLVGLSYNDFKPVKNGLGAGLADDWTVSPDAKTWTFKLRHNVRWQDGQPVTARDVAFTYNYMIDNATSNWTNYTQSIKHVTAVDDYTVRVDCSQPKVSMASGWVPILPEHIWSKISAAAAQKSFTNGPPIIGSGPFQCVEWKHKQYVRLVANKNYWGGAPKVDEVVFQIYQNEDTMVQDLKSGGLDAASNLLPVDLTILKGTPGIVAQAIRDNGFDELSFNCYTGPSLGNPVLRDWRFRQALNYAVDRAKITSVVYSGYSTAGDTPITASYYKNPDWHWTPPAGVAYTFDLKKAGQLLDQAGYKMGPGGVRVYKGKPIVLRMWARDESATSQLSAKLLTGWFRQLGLKITLSVMDEGALESRLYNTVKGVFTPDFDMFLWGWYGDIDPSIILADFTTAQINGFSDCNWSNKQYDALWVEQGRTVDTAKRKQLIDQMQQIWYQQSPYVILGYSDDIEAWNTAHWRGWFHSPSSVGNVVVAPYGPGSIITVQPIKAGTSGGGANVLIAVAAAAAVIIILAVWIVVRRRGGRAVVEDE